ncbi:DNA primase [Streptomyces sp. SA15]|uniref:bifunctional DNA primase/polymerase n=1 Tax=Streptomyces sp. SA15 TaxID=934019 RepID=UPI000BB0A27B|nr:bifunctional DNA primase/polymerase [Streptomyces sp. SA15]PAZ17527.1 DNA primase [Streptomyces sp. SA15]
MTHDPRSALLHAALDAAERGWHVFPLRPGTKRPALHGETACPHTGPCTTGHQKWEQRATTDPDRIRAAWSHTPFNIGIATGPSGLVVIDLDMPKDKGTSDAPSGATTFKALCERAGHAVPDTYRTRTASGGEHLYFTAPDGIRLSNTAGTIGELVDTRAWGGYVVAAGSTIPTGRYEALCGSVAAPLPGWLQTILQPAPKPTHARSVPVSTHAPAYAAAALRNEVNNVATATDGTRNTTLLRAARALGRLIASGDLHRTEVEDALSRAAAANATQSQHYYDDVISRGLGWSIANNRGKGRAA